MSRMLNDARAAQFGELELVVCHVQGETYCGRLCRRAGYHPEAYGTASSNDNDVAEVNVARSTACSEHDSGSAKRRAPLAAT